MSRDYYAKQDSTNQALKVKEDDSYYSFLKDMPLNDVKTVLANKTQDIYQPFRIYGPVPEKHIPTSLFLHQTALIILIRRKALLTFLKEKGVKLNKEQEAIRLRQEKLGRNYCQNYNEAVNCREREDGIAL